MHPLTLSLFWSLVSAQAVVQDSWINPSLPDLSVIITDGQQYQLTWDNTLQNWFPHYAPEASTTNVTLWVAAVQLRYFHIVEQYIDITRTKFITWTANLPESEYSKDQNWSFRFTPANFTSLDAKDSNEVDSPQFIYKAASSTSSSSSSTASQTSSSSTATSASSTAAAATTSAAASTAGKSSKIGGGAIAGIVIGAIAGIALVAALFFLLFRLRRKDADLKNEQRQQKMYNESSSYGATSPSMGGGDSVQPYYAAPPAESQAYQPFPQPQPHELHGNETQELDSEQIKPPATELQGGYEPYRSPK